MFNLFKKKEEEEKEEKILELVWDRPPEECAVEVRPAPLQREWMDETQGKYAYRCLPLNIANQHGWAVYPKSDLVVRGHRDDRIHEEDVEVVVGDGRLAVSHFGHGTFTIVLPFVPRLSKGYSLWIGGAPNHFINGASALTGIYEADWGPFTATMNWKITRKNFNIRFTPNDPVCFMFPIYRPDIEEFKVKNINMSEYHDQEWLKNHNEWRDSRGEFVKRLKAGDTGQGEWQRHYFQGKYVNGDKCPYTGNLKHRTKLDLDDPGKNK